MARTRSARTPGGLIPLDDETKALIAAALAPTVTLWIFIVQQWIAGRRDQHARRRERFAQAYEAVVEYQEFPYVVRRRRTSAPEEERIRISTEMRRTQERLGFHLAWLTTESGHVARAYERLVAELRRHAGSAVHDAWLEDPIRDDSGMNVADVGPRIAVLTPFCDTYLLEVVDHLSLWPRSTRRLGRAARRSGGRLASWPLALWRAARR